MEMHDGSNYRSTVVLAGGVGRVRCLMCVVWDPVGSLLMFTLFHKAICT